MRVLIKIGEIFLKKSSVRKRMTKKLIKNIKKSLGKCEIKTDRNVLVLETKNKTALNKLKYIFGIEFFSPALICNKDLDSILKTVEKLVTKRQTFKIQTKRSDKSFQYTSLQLNKIIGQKLEKIGYKVNLEKPQKMIHIEIRNNAYVYDKIFRGPGGLPVGSSGCAIGFCENENNTLANWLLMKRGCDIIIATKKLTQKRKKLLKKLERCSPQINIIRFNSINDIKKFTKRKNIKAAVTAETDIEKIKKMKKVCGLLVFTPLSGTDKNL